MDSKRIFADGYCFSKIFSFFILGMIIGVLWEQLWTFYSDRLLQPRVGLIYGPFNPVYGLGFAIFYAVLGKNDVNRNWYITFFMCFLLGGFTEYITSWISEVIFGVSAWDYSNHFLNIQGRTTIILMLGWGFGGLLLLKYVYPFVGSYIEKIAYQSGRRILIFMTVFLIINGFVTIAVTLRHTDRVKGVDVPATTAINQVIDFYYPEAVYKSIFQNVDVVGE